MKSIIMALCLICLCTALFLSCSTPEKALEGAILTGRVTDTDTTIYLAGVKVFEKSHAELSTVTDSAGYFRLDGVMFEEHNIYFEQDGYEPYTLWFEYTGHFDRPVVTHHITMTPIAEEQ